MRTRVLYYCQPLCAVAAKLTFGGTLASWYRATTLCWKLAKREFQALVHLNLIIFVNDCCPMPIVQQYDS